MRLNADVDTSPPLPKLLLVDDDPLIVDALGFFLGSRFQVKTVATRSDAVSYLRSAESPPAVALIDLGLPPFPHRPDEGLALISDILAHDPAIRIIVLSGQNDEAHARHARALGATEFVPKPADPNRLLSLIDQVCAFDDGLALPVVALEGIVGRSPPIEKLRAQLRQYADSPFPVLIAGESGCGKELVAHALHSLSSRVGKPFLALNCAAISPTLVEPTLFGHAKGAFTGAPGARAGYFEEAAESTLFLDEIGELPLDLQPKLLRVLENGEFQRVGETQPRRSRARIVTATNRDLRKEVREGRFRSDLYHRLSVFVIDVPPLRELGGDREFILDHYRHQYASQSGRQAFSLDAAARACLLAYSFPGNVRELRNIAIRLSAKHPGQAVTAAMLEAELDSDLEDSPIAPEGADNLLEHALRQLRTVRHFSLDETLRRWETAYVEAAQQLAHGNVSQAARLLGINRTTLYNRLENLHRSPRRSDQQ